MSFLGSAASAARRRGAPAAFGSIHEQATSDGDRDGHRLTGGQRPRHRLAAGSGRRERRRAYHALRRVGVRDPHRRRSARFRSRAVDRAEGCQEDGPVHPLRHRGQPAGASRRGPGGGRVERRADRRGAGRRYRRHRRHRENDRDLPCTRSGQDQPVLRAEHDHQHAAGQPGHHARPQGSELVGGVRLHDRHPQHRVGDAPDPAR